MAMGWSPAEPECCNSLLSTGKVGQVGSGYQGRWRAMVINCTAKESLKRLKPNVKKEKG